jgi:hypothetical protein
MRGFAPSLPAIYRLLGGALDTARGVYLEVDHAETAYFSSKRKFFAVTHNFNPAPVPVASEYTNLDEAVERASNNDLSIVITDGVPASSKRKSDCSTGVDLGCVADKLARTLAAGPVPKSEPAGLWIVPVIAQYDGTFFTEQLRPRADFSAAMIESNVTRDTGDRGARAKNPRNDGNGDLMFDYSGPRMMMIVVLSRFASAGRGYTREIYSNAATAAISVKQSAIDFTSGIAILPALEVYPGWVHPNGWQGCRKTEELSGAFGPCSFPQPTRLVLECGSRPAQARYQIIERSTIGNILYGLPSLEISYPPLPRGNLQQIKWQEFGRSANVLVSCSQTKPAICGDSSRTTWSGITVYDRKALAEGSSARYLASLSTDDPTAEPHRLFGLASLIRNLYERQLQSVKMEVATLEVCQK